jgi:hypothetical protein
MPEIAGWLDNLGMSEYAEHFAENKIDVRQRAAADGAGHGGDVEPQLLLIDRPAVWAALRPASENDLATSLSGSRLGLSRPNSPLMAAYLGDLQVQTC